MQVGLIIGVRDRGGDRKYFSGKNQSVKFGNFVDFSGKYHKKLGYFDNFSGKNHVKFGHFVIFRAKMLCPLKLTELLRLWVS